MTTVELIQQRGAETFDRGPNVRKGHVAIRCPWCGDADPSHHLNVHLETGAFSCFRNIQHRGRRPHALLMKLFGCSREVAQAMLTDTSDLASIRRRMARKEDQQTEVAAVVDVEEEPGLVPLMYPSRLYSRFRDYLFRRGFDHQHHEIMAELYGLQCALTGRFKNRIVFPIRAGKMTVGYTGRAIDNGNLRYLSHPGDVVKRHVLWENLILGGRTLYICEGPFDALKVDCISRMSELPDRATCTFGVNVALPQIERMGMFARSFDRVAILFDDGAMGAALHVQRELRMSGVAASVRALPDGVKDPGAMSWEQVIGLAKHEQLTA